MLLDTIKRTTKLIFRFTFEFLKKVYFKAKSKIPEYYQKNLKYIYPSLYIGSMAMLVISIEFGIQREIQLSVFLISTFIAYRLVKSHQLINIHLEREKKYFEVWKIPYLLFFAYLMINYKNQVSRYITQHLNIESDTFNSVIYYISTMVTIQYSIFLFIVPISILFIIKITGFIATDLNKSKKLFYNFYQVLVVSFVFVILASFVIPKYGYAITKPYEYWIERYGFVDYIHCKGGNYSENITYRSFKAHKLSNQTYLIVSKSGQNMKNYNYYELSCKEIKSQERVFNNGLLFLKNNILNIKKSTLNKFLKKIEYSIYLPNPSIFYLLQTHNLTFSSFHSNIK